MVDQSKVMNNNNFLSTYCILLKLLQDIKKCAFFKMKAKFEESTDFDIFFIQNFRYGVIYNCF